MRTDAKAADKDENEFLRSVLGILQLYRPESPECTSIETLRDWLLTDVGSITYDHLLAYASILQQANRRDQLYADLHMYSKEDAEQQKAEVMAAARTLDPTLTYPDAIARQGLYAARILEIAPRPQTIELRDWSGRVRDVTDDEWRVVNDERGRLIRKKTDEGLTPKEQLVFDRLQGFASAYADSVAPVRSDQFAALMAEAHAEMTLGSSK